MQFEELPAGEGYADVVYIPLPDCTWPPLVIELKWNKDAKGAIDQILAKKYPVCFKNYKGRLLLVGINYDKEMKRHSCKIKSYVI